MWTRNKLIKELTRQVYWKTKKKSNEKEIMEIISSFLKRNEDAIELYLKEPDYMFKRCKSAMQGRKEALVTEKNRSLEN